MEAVSLVCKDTVMEAVTEVYKKNASSQMYDISSPQMSNSEVASLHLKELRKKMPTFVMPQTEGPQICQEDELCSLIDARKLAMGSAKDDKTKAAIAHECYLCWQMTPFLQTLFEQIGIVVNSEEYKWLCTYSEAKKNYMKPDFFVTLKGLMARKESSGNSFVKALRKTESVEYDFGTMPWEIRDCMRVLIEFKNKLAPEDFGTLVIYLQHLSRNSPGHVYYGMLCDDTNIILASCCDSTICSRYELKWTDQGSQAFVRNFVHPQNPWMQLLSLSLSQLGVQLLGDEAFLGMGRNGRVFKIQDGEERVLALKIVLSPNGDEGLANSVFAEHNVLKEFKEKNLPVVTVLGEAHSVYVEGDDHCLGVCYVMEEVGTPVTVKNEDQLRAVFMLLFALHSQNEFHGDPRLSNIIWFEEKLLWIDLFKLHVSKSQDFMRLSFESDIRTLTGSVSKVYALQLENSLDFDECARTYAGSPSEARLNGILSILLGTP